MMPFHPMVDGDILLATPTDALASGEGAGVALVAGTTGDEMRLFVDASAPAPPREKFVRRAARYLGLDEAAAAPVVDHYAQALGTDDTNAIWRAVFGDNEMQLPCRAVLEAHAPHGPTYTYCFTWEGPQVGSCHGIDIPFTFGNFVDGWDAFVALDDDGRALSNAMRAAWAGFARTGDPGWAAYPAARIFGRKVYDAAQHPLFARLPTL
jgi:para-nitrobenzyl esterase